MNRLQAELMRPRKWFSAKQNKSEPTEIHIYDVIGPDFWGEGNGTVDIVKEIRAAESDEIHVYIDSPGGIAYDGIAIYNALIGSGKEVTTIIDGIAASAASIVFMGGKNRIVPEAGMGFIHNAWTIFVGDKNSFAKESEALAKLDKQMSGIYSRTSGYDEEKIISMMDDETYFDSKELFEIGFVTEIVEGQKIAACNWDLGILAELPAGFVKMRKAYNKRNLENNLRDAGYSVREAKRLAGGPREADDSEIVNALKQNIELFKKGL